MIKSPSWLAVLTSFLSLPAFAAPPPTYICPSAKAGDVAPTCAVKTACAVPTKATDMVRTSIDGKNQLWEPYSTLTATSAVANCSTGTWSTLAGLGIPLFSSTPTLPTALTPLTISWTAPTTNTDNSPLTDLASYNLYSAIGTVAPKLLATIKAPATSYATAPLAPGFYSFSVTAVNAAGAESDKSAIVSITLPLPIPLKPSPPSKPVAGSTPPAS